MIISAELFLNRGLLHSYEGNDQAALKDLEQAIWILWQQAERTTDHHIKHTKLVALAQSFWARAFIHLQLGNGAEFNKDYATTIHLITKQKTFHAALLNQGKVAPLAWIKLKINACLESKDINSAIRNVFTNLNPQFFYCSHFMREHHYQEYFQALEAIKIQAELLFKPPVKDLHLRDHFHYASIYDECFELLINQSTDDDSKEIAKSNYVYANQFYKNNMTTVPSLSFLELGQLKFIINSTLSDGEATTAHDTELAELLKKCIEMASNLINIYLPTSDVLFDNRFSYQIYLYNHLIKCRLKYQTALAPDVESDFSQIYKEDIADREKKIPLLAKETLENRINFITALNIQYENYLNNIFISKEISEIKTIKSKLKTNAKLVKKLQANKISGILNNSTTKSIADGASSFNYSLIKTHLIMAKNLINNSCYHSAYYNFLAAFKADNNAKELAYLKNTEDTLSFITDLPAFLKEFIRAVDPEEEKNSTRGNDLIFAGEAALKNKNYREATKLLSLAIRSFKHNLGIMPFVYIPLFVSRGLVHFYNQSHELAFNDIEVAIWLRHQSILNPAYDNDAIPKIKKLLNLTRLYWLRSLLNLEINQKKNYLYDKTIAEKLIQHHCKVANLSAEHNLSHDKPIVEWAKKTKEKFSRNPLAENICEIELCFDPVFFNRYYFSHAKHYEEFIYVLNFLF